MDNDTKIYRLNQFGLKLAALEQSNLPMKARIHFALPQIHDIVKIKISDRKKHCAKYFKDSLQKVISAFEGRQLEVLGSPKMPSGFCGIFRGSELLDIASFHFVDKIDLIEVDGKELPVTEVEHSQDWYTVVAEYIVQVEGQIKGYQTHEIRHVLVKAESFEQAEEKFMGTTDEYAEPYLNSDMCLVRWRFKRIIDVYIMCDPPNDLIETYSDLQNRKFNQEFFWDGK